MIRAHKDKRTSKQARSERARIRAIQTGAVHYDLSPENIGDCHQQIRRSKSSFVMRWGKLNIHRVLSAVGTVFAAYDGSLKLISFFIPKSTGLAIAKGAKSAAWGHCKRSGVLLLPPLAKKPPPRVHEQTAKPGEEASLTQSEASAIRDGLKRRIRFLQSAIDTKMELSPSLHWAEIVALGDRVEELEALLAALPVAAPEPTAALQMPPQETQRQRILDDLDSIEQEMASCPMHELLEKSDRLTALKKALSQLIPNKGAIDRREALHQATETLRNEINAFQATRDYANTATLADDRKTMAGMRSRLRTLLGMHRALFGTSFFMDPPTEPTASEPDPTGFDAQGLTGEEALMARFSYLNQAIGEIDRQVKNAEAGMANGLLHRRLMLIRELGTMPTKQECASLNDEEIDRVLLRRRILSIRDYLGWFMSKHDTTVGPAKHHLIDVEEQFADLVSEYNERYPQSLKESDGLQSTTEQISGTRH